MGHATQQLGHPLAIDHEASGQRLDCHLRQPVIFLLLGKLTLDAWSLALAFGIRLADNVCVGAILLDDNAGALAPLFQLLVIGVGVITFVGGDR